MLTEPFHLPSYLLLSKLAGLMGTPISGKPLAVAVQKIVFSATISWPVAVSVIAVSLALTKITTTLADKGYETERMIQQGDRKYTIKFKPRKREAALMAGSELTDAKAAWKVALAADAQDHPVSTEVTEEAE